MFNVRLNKRSVILIGGAVLVMAAFFFLMAPLFGEVCKIGREVKALDREMAAARQAIELQKKFPQMGKLLTRPEISLAIDEMTKMGAARNINFLSISPQRIVKAADSKYPVLPIQMDIQSGYKDLGLFLGDLEEFKRSVIMVKSFQVEADRSLLPQIETDLVVEVYLQEGEDG